MQAFNTKQDYRQFVEAVAKPLEPYYARNCTRLDLGVTATQYGTSTCGMEAFSRPLWALVPYWAGGGSDLEQFKQIYRDGLSAGTNPESPDYWGTPGDGDQQFVEMAAIAYGLLLVPDILWEPLGEESKQNLVNWLNMINEHSLPDCNWLLFNVIVNIALKKLRQRYSETILQRNLDRVDSFYIEDGWYYDGHNNQRDYYVPWGFEFYTLFYAVLMKDEDPDRCAVFRNRATAFGREFAYWFDETGRAIPYGRSLTYRFAQCAFYSICIVAGIEPLTVPQMKGIIVRNMEYWDSLSIFDKGHILTIGYGYPNLMMAEQYNGPGSPYWALKSMAVLMLPDGHPFWPASPALLPPMEEQHLQVPAGLLLHRYSGHVTAFTPGRDSVEDHGHTYAKYCKFAYDSLFAFNVPKSNNNISEAAPDSMLAFEIDGVIYTRKNSKTVVLDGKSIVSSWSPHRGINVTTTIKPTDHGHIRRHEIKSDLDIPYTIYDCAFAVESDTGSDEAVAMTDYAEFKNNKCSCRITNTGQVPGTGVVINAFPNTNIVYPSTQIPAIKYVVAGGCTEMVLESEITVRCKYDAE